MAYFLLGLAFFIVIGGFAYFLPDDEKSLLSGASDVMNTHMTLTSSAFKQGERIPSKFTCDGENINPPLSIQGIPEGAVSLVLIMDDPDVPKVLKPDGVFDHWVLYDLDPSLTEIPEGSSAGIAGLNGKGDPSYTGPCPPSEYEPSEHRYFFKLYALNRAIDVTGTPNKTEVLKAMEGSIIEEAELMGTYKKIK